MKALIPFYPHKERYKYYFYLLINFLSAMIFNYLLIILNNIFKKEKELIRGFLYLTSL
jgi:hypothetical protein